MEQTKSISKRLLAVMLSLAMVFSLVQGVSFSASAATTATSGDYVYRVLDDGTAEITEYSGSESVLTIPSKIDRFTVTSIGDSAFFSFAPTLEIITIPNSVKSIGERAFWMCDTLKSVTIGNSVVSIGPSAFSECYSLTSVTIPNSVKSIGGGAFWKCYLLTDITLPNSIESIGGEAFWNCDSLTNITIPKSVTSIGGSAFESCYSLKSVVIGNSVKSIGDKTFRDCDSLTTVTLPNSVLLIGEDAFNDCGMLSTVNFLGSKEQWNRIAIEDGNLFLTTANIKFCSHSNSVTDKAVAATCLKSGKTTGSHCKDCGTVIKKQSIVKAHSTTVKNKKSATYFAKGYSGDTYCNTCNKVVKNGTATAKKTLKKPTVKVTAGKKQIKVKYTKVSGATGFQVQYKKGKKTVTKTFSTKKSATKAITKLAKGTYKVKVRAMVTSGKKKAYSTWTKTKNITIK